MRLVCMLMVLIPLGVQAEEILLGAGARNRPVFDGSADQTTDLIPVLRYYGKPWFARTTQGVLEGGARFALKPGLDGGVQLAYEQGPRDGDPGASLGLHMELDTKIGPAPLNLLARTRTQLDSDRGSQADLRATLGIYGGGGLQAGVFGQATWASEKHMQAYYGVGDAGLLFTSVGLLGSYDLARHWVAVASAELRRLASEPSRSGFVQDRTNHYLSAGLAYRF
jgi:outer membrane scaffolding protein for murein synthesis (MipA/OmpV family)